MTEDGMMTKEDLLKHLEEESQVFKNPKVKAAFTAIDRKDFIGEDYEYEAYEDYALPTVEGQTISQPTKVAFMLELLDAKPGDAVLDIGSGSGWTSALLGSMVGPEGKVVGLEMIPSLVEQSKKSLKKYSDLPVEIFQATKEAGLFKEGPYNRIIGSAALPTLEHQAIFELLLQLVKGGTMVLPIGDSLYHFEKVDDEDYVETEYPGFTFAPYIE